jgi:LacI family transcriptional regulator
MRLANTAGFRRDGSETRPCDDPGERLYRPVLGSQGGRGRPLYALEVRAPGRSARRPTIREVAALAGVSISTAARVVNGQATVDPALAAKVLSAVEMLGYRKQRAAGSLRGARSGTVGVIVDDVTNPFFAAVLRGVQDVARPRGVMTLSGSSDDRGADERSLVNAYLERGVEGLLIVPSATDQSYLQPDVRSGTVAVFLDRPPQFLDADAVVCDNVTGLRIAVAHLVAAGHQRIGLIIADRPGVFTAEERRRGFEEGLRAHGLPVESSFIGSTDLRGSDADAVVRQLLEADAPPTALITAHNLITVGALRGLHALGLEHEVALVAFDDLPLAESVKPPLTVVTQDSYGIGRRAAELLFERLDGFDGPGRRVVLPTTLIARGSGEIAPPPR